MEKRCWITENQIEVASVIEQVTRRDAGANNTFIGTVREFTKGKRTFFYSMQLTLLWLRKN